MDEATAALDFETDQLMRRLAQEHFNFVGEIGSGRNIVACGGGWERRSIRQPPCATAMASLSHLAAALHHGTDTSRRRVR